MFVRLIEGTTDDADAAAAALDRWNTEVMAGVEGFLGSTSGVADDGRVVLAARFADAEAAARSDERPACQEWWGETKALLDGDPTVSGTDQVDVLFGGGSDDAGFVQLISSTVADRAAYAELEAVFTQHAPTARPDVMGSIALWLDGDRLVEIIYFTSEAEARAGESADPPPELAAAMAQMPEVMVDPSFLDLTAPRLHTP